MAKPRIFISSTYYDLKQTREDISSFIETLGYESVRNEEGNIPYGNNENLEAYCYKEINNIDILVSIIGGRFGSQANESCWSISNEELKTAIKHNKQVYIFIDKNVYTEYEIYIINKNNDSVKYKFADDVRIYQFIEEIKGLASNNNIKSFDTSADILHYLKEQLAGLFQSFLDSQSKTKEYNLAQKLENVTKNLENTIDSLVEFNKNSSECATNLMMMTHPIVRRLSELLTINFGFWIKDYKDLSNFLTNIGWSNLDEYENSSDSSVYNWELRIDNKMRHIKVSKDIFHEDGSLREIKYTEWKDNWINIEETETLNNSTNNFTTIEDLPFQNMEEHCYIISYDLSNPSRNYDAIIKAIKQYPIWGRLTESTWAVVTKESVTSIRDTLMKFIDTNDKLIVIRSGKQAAWTRCLADTKWIKENLIK